MLSLVEPLTARASRLVFLSELAPNWRELSDELSHQPSRRRIVCRTRPLSGALLMAHPHHVTA